MQGLYPLGYVPHNHHFLWFAASMEGASEIARDAALQTAARVNLPELMRQPGFAGLQHYWMTPWFDRVRFGRWDEIAARAQPGARPALRHGDLALRAGDGGVAAGTDGVEPSSIMRRSRSWLPIRHGDADGLGPLSACALPHSIAERTVCAELALARGDRDAAIAALREAVVDRGLDSLRRAARLACAGAPDAGRGVARGAGRPADAEAVYREELQRNPANGWSLRGLADSLRAQKRGPEAAETEQLLAAAWANADVKPSASRL